MLARKVFKSRLIRNINTVVNIPTPDLPIPKHKYILSAQVEIHPNKIIEVTDIQLDERLNDGYFCFSFFLSCWGGIDIIARIAPYIVEVLF